MRLTAENFDRSHSVPVDVALNTPCSVIATSASGDRVPTVVYVFVLAACVPVGRVLSVAYCLGLGVPFVLAALAFRRALGAFGWVKRHYAWVMTGGGMMIVTGLLLLTGAWDTLMQEMQVWSDGFTVGI